jgi:RNA ligase
MKKPSKQVAFLFLTTDKRSAIMPVMIKHISYPSIGQFRNAIRSVSDHARYVGRDENGDAIFDQTKQPPKLTYRGTVKLHGTNAAIGRFWNMDPSEHEIWFQSRERIISVGSDNAGFAARFHGQDLDNTIFDQFNDDGTVIIFGEWCGQGIQKTVAIGNLPKMFVVFDVLVDGVWQDKSVVEKIKCEALSVYNIYDYQTEELEIDFSCPENSQNKLVELTQKVADRCPVGFAFGQEGIGEGIVWSCVTPGWTDPGYKFKVKDERHAKGAGKCKVLAEVDAQAVAGIKEFAALVVTDGRCNQGVDKMRERGLKIDRSCLGHYINWVFDDVVKEETDVAVKSNIDLGKAKSEIMKLAREWFFKNEKNL